jgi:hypothetical protein
VQNTCANSCAPGKGWQCLDTPIPWPKPTNLGNFTFAVTIVDLLSEYPFDGATVKACKQLDLQCTDPLDQSVTDKDGLVSLTVPAGSVGFNGYLEITGGDNHTDTNTPPKPRPIFPALYYPVPPIVAPGWRGRLQFVSESDLPILAVFTTVQIDPMRGHFAANAVDCNFSGTGGVSLSADTVEAHPEDMKTKTFYFIQGQPTIGATETDGLTPIGGFVNLLPNSTLVTATTTVGGTKKKVASVTYNIRAGWFTTSSFPPAGR